MKHDHITERYFAFLKDTFTALKRRPERRMVYKAMHFEIPPVAAAQLQCLGIARYYGCKRWEWTAEPPTMKMAKQLREGVNDLLRGCARQHTINKAKPDYRPRRSTWRHRYPIMTELKRRSPMAKAVSQLR